MTKNRSTAWRITGDVVTAIATAISAGLSAINVMNGGKPSPPPERVKPPPDEYRP